MKVGQHRAAVRARHSGRRREGVGTVLHRGARLQRTSKDGREKCEQVEAANDSSCHGDCHLSSANAANNLPFEEGEDIVRAFLGLLDAGPD